MTAINFSAASAYALSRIEREIEPQFCYHNILHTRDDVHPAAVRLGRLCGVSADEMVLLETAALFHDIGFIEQGRGHETISARIVGEMLPRWGFSAENIQTIQQMICATALPQSPQTLLDKILCDSDLDILGHDDFLPRNLLLYAELSATGREVGLHDWYTGQHRFLVNHTYHTPAARTLRDAGKARNTTLLQNLANATSKKSDWHEQL